MANKTEEQRLTKKFYRLLDDIAKTPKDNPTRFYRLKRKLQKVADQLKPILEAKEQAKNK